MSRLRRFGILFVLNLVIGFASCFISAKITKTEKLKADFTLQGSDNRTIICTFSCSSVPYWYKSIVLVWCTWDTYFYNSYGVPGNKYYV